MIIFCYVTKTVSENFHASNQYQKVRGSVFNNLFEMSIRRQSNIISTYGTIQYLVSIFPSSGYLKKKITKITKYRIWNLLDFSTAYMNLNCLIPTKDFYRQPLYSTCDWPRYLGAIWWRESWRQLSGRIRTVEKRLVSFCGQHRIAGLD